MWVMLVAASKLLAVMAGSSIHPAHLPCWPTWVTWPACLGNPLPLFVPDTALLFCWSRFLWTSIHWANYFSLYMWVITTVTLPHSACKACFSFLFTACMLLEASLDVYGFQLGKYMGEIKYRHVSLTLYNIVLANSWTIFVYGMFMVSYI